MNRARTRGHINQRQSNNKRFGWSRNVFRKQWGSGCQWKWTGWEPKEKWNKNRDMRTDNRELRTENWELRTENWENWEIGQGQCRGNGQDHGVCVVGSINASQTSVMNDLMFSFVLLLFFIYLFFFGKPNQTKPQQTAQRSPGDRKREWKIPDNSLDFTFRAARCSPDVVAPSSMWHDLWGSTGGFIPGPAEYRIPIPDSTALSWPRICVRNDEKCFNKQSQAGQRHGR